MSAIESFARIPRALAILARHPEGLPLGDVASELGVSEEQLRLDILQYYSADIPADALMGLQRPETIEFLAADGAEEDPGLAPVIRAVSDRPTAELGVEYLRADQLATLYEAARSLSETEPDNEALGQAVRTLADSFLADASVEEAAATDVTATLRRALDHNREVELVYSRAWRPGVAPRTVQPLALRHTRRGWELDAGPLVDGHTRTFLVDRISSATLTDTAFEPPPGLAAILADERRRTRVELSMPQRTHWVADRFAESTSVKDSDADDMTVVAEFLPPVAERLGLILLTAGPDAFVLDPVDLQDSAAGPARRLLAHHDL